MPNPKTLRIELNWWNGIVVDDADLVAEPYYELLDHLTGEPVAAQFKNCQALEAYIAAHHPDCERAPLPLAPPEEVKKAETALALMDNPPPGFEVRHLRPALVGQYYQWSHSPETMMRLRCALGLPDLTR
jgi:hypothetical protein